jgi:hypothetical protein
METKTVRRKQHSHKVIIEDQAIQQHLTDVPAMYISYVLNTHSVSYGTLVGNVITNFLIGTNTHPNANVVGVDKTGKFFSLYGFNLFAPIEEIAVGHLSISRANFNNREEEIAGLEALVSFLDQIDGKQYEDMQLFKQAIAELESMRPLPPPVQQTSRATYTGPRNSLPYKVPLGTKQPMEELEEDTSSSEDEYVAQTVVHRTPTVVPVRGTRSTVIQSPVIQTPYVRTPFVQGQVVQRSAVPTPVPRSTVIRR